MKRVAVVLSLLAVVTASAIAWPQGFKAIKEFLTGYEEVPSVSTTGNGKFSARISNDESVVSQRYSNAISKLQTAL